MGPLEVVKLTSLMGLTAGRPEISVGLIDGPVLLTHPDLDRRNIRQISDGMGAGCAVRESAACIHGTFVAGMLAARRGSVAPAICPECTLLVRPIFSEASQWGNYGPTASAAELASAIVDCVKAGARVLNLSAALAESSLNGRRQLQEALDFAAIRGVISVVAAGNQGVLGSSVITRHSFVIPVVSCDLTGRPLNDSNLGNSIARAGLMAPGNNVTSLGTDGTAQIFAGTSAATPFVTGTVALLWSEFPDIPAAEIVLAVTRAGSLRRRTVAPPLLDASLSYEIVSNKSLRNAMAL